jgi:hypothetical protein
MDKIAAVLIDFRRAERALDRCGMAYVTSEDVLRMSQTLYSKALTPANSLINRAALDHQRACLDDLFTASAEVSRLITDHPAELAACGLTAENGWGRAYVAHIAAA